jgi:hypothetical protein
MLHFGEKTFFIRSMNGAIIFDLGKNPLLERQRIRGFSPSLGGV